MTAHVEEDFKMPLRLWLVKQINSGRYLGLEWKDLERKSFKIPWTPKNNPNWDDHFQIFIAWAKHRGTFDPNNIDVKKLKGNFRCALNKSDDFEELKNESELKQQTNNYRVYRVLQPDEVIAIKKNRKRKMAPKKQPNSLTNPPNEKIPTTESNAPGNSNWNNYMSGTGNIISVNPSVPHATYEERGFSLTPNPLLNPIHDIIPPPDLDLIDSNLISNPNMPLMQMQPSVSTQSSTITSYNNNMLMQGSNMMTQSNSQFQEQHNFQAGNTYVETTQVDDIFSFSPGPISPSEYIITESPGEFKLPNPVSSAPGLHQAENLNNSITGFFESMQIPTNLMPMFQLSAMYGSTVCYNREVDLQHRLRVLYGKLNLQKAIYDALPPDKMNQKDIFDIPGIELPEYNGKSVHIPKILDKTDLGIVFHYDSGILYGRRFCQSQVFYYDNLKRNPVPTKMVRGVETELFSFKKYLLELAEAKKDGRRKSVDSSVTLVIGTKPNLGKQHDPVSLHLETILSKNLQNTFNPSLSGTSLAMSDANSLDNLIRAITSLDL